MSRHHCEVATWAAVWTAEMVSRHEFEVATLATLARLGLMSRHGIAMSRHRLVFRMSRHGVDVTTWVGRPGGRDMKWMSRHRVATWLGTGQEKRCRDTNVMSRHGVAWVGVATWSWCRDMGQAA